MVSAGATDHCTEMNLQVSQFYRIRTFLFVSIGILQRFTKSLLRVRRMLQRSNGIVSAKNVWSPWFNEILSINPIIKEPLRPIVRYREKYGICYNLQPMYSTPFVAEECCLCSAERE